MNIADSKSIISLTIKDQTSVKKPLNTDNNKDFQSDWKPVTDKPKQPELSTGNDVKGELQQMPSWKPNQSIKKKDEVIEEESKQIPQINPQEESNQVSLKEDNKGI